MVVEERTLNKCLILQQGKHQVSEKATRQYTNANRAPSLSCLALGERRFPFVRTWSAPSTVKPETGNQNKSDFSSL